MKSGFVVLVFHKYEPVYFVQILNQILRLLQILLSGPINNGWSVSGPHTILHNPYKSRDGNDIHQFYSINGVYEWTKLILIDMDVLILMNRIWTMVYHPLL